MGERGKTLRTERSVQLKAFGKAPTSSGFFFHYVEHISYPDVLRRLAGQSTSRPAPGCETVANQKVKRSLGTSPRPAFEAGAPALRRCRPISPAGA